MSIQITPAIQDAESASHRVQIGEMARFGRTGLGLCLSLRNRVVELRIGEIGKSLAESGNLRRRRGGSQPGRNRRALSGFEREPGLDPGPQAREGAQGEV